MHTSTFKVHAGHVKHIHTIPLILWLVSHRPPSLHSAESALEKALAAPIIVRVSGVWLVSIAAASLFTFIPLVTRLG